MNIKRFFLTMLLAAGLTGGVVWLLSGGLAARAAPAYGVHVCPSGCAFSSIQEAVDAATPGELIQVATGVYTGVHQRNGITQVVYISKSVTIRGGYNADFSACDPIAYPTTLDAQGQGRVLYITGDHITPTITGLRITGGATPGSEIRGGGVFVSGADAIISGNVIYSNTAAYYGGGVYLEWDKSVLRSNTIQSNTASLGVGSGGGLYLSFSAATLEDNLIQHNAAHSGGGMHLFRSDARLAGNTIAGNEASLGGGLDFVQQCNF